MTNLVFVELSFVDLDHSDQPRLITNDMIVTWISR
jgi:hypothetical protein